MDFNDPAQRAVFFDVHNGLPREGPGNRASAARALNLASPLPKAPAVLDIGCGPGQQTLQLAEMLPGARIVAIDMHQPFLDQLTADAAQAGVGERVEARLGDMTALDFEPGSFDLVWCEAAIYVMGFREALVAWKPLLATGGRLAVSEPFWLRPHPPSVVTDFWREYPGMKDLDTCRGQVEEAGYKLLGDFVLPEEAWWEHYYSPMEVRLAELGARHAGDSVAESVLAECRQEIELYRNYSAFYGYGFFVMTPDTSQI